MAKIHLKHLISFSSQDPVFCAENLITKSSTNKPFLCSKEDRSGILEAEFELDRASFISYIDIGNHGSSTIEIMVGRSSGPRNANYVCLLPAATFMSLNDKKIGRNLNAVRMFQTENFTKTASREKWDRVKVICGQPYMKDIQFGISFLHLRGKESITPQNGLADVLNSDISKNSSALRLNLLKRPFPSDGFQSRGRHLLNSSLANTAKKKRKPVPYSFQIAALTFLTADFEDDLFSESRSFEDYMEEFEKQREQRLTDDEKSAFHTIYNNFVSGTAATLADLTSQENGDISASPSNGYAASQKRLTNGTHSRVDISDTENSEDIKGLDFRSEKTLQKHNGIRNSFGRSFDFTSNNNTPFRSNGEKYTESQKRLRKTPNGQKSPDFECSSQRSNTPKFDLDIQIKPKPVNGHGLTNGNKPKDPAETPTQFKVGFLRPEDFIQFDGSEPTTSKGVIYVDCPICGDPFHTAEIEAHAANCGTPESEQLNNGALMLKRNGTPTHQESKKRNSLHFLRERSDPNRVYSTLVECPVCGNYFDQDEVHGHTNICIEKCNV